MLRAVQFAGADLNWKEGRKASVYKIHFPQLDQKGRVIFCWAEIEFLMVSTQK